MKAILVLFCLAVGVLEGQSQQTDRGDAIERLIDEQTKPRIIIKCDGLDWALVITAKGWGAVFHGSSPPVHAPTGLDCEKIIKDLDLVPDDGTRLPDSPPVAYVQLVSGGKLNNYKTFKRDVVARCFIDVAEAMYQDRGGAEAYFKKRGHPSCLRDTDFQNRQKSNEPPTDDSTSPNQPDSERRSDQDNMESEPMRDPSQEDGEIHSNQETKARTAEKWGMVAKSVAGVLVLVLVFLGSRRLLHK